MRAPLPLRLAIRELRSGLSGFTVFVACIALGVAAIAGVGSLARTLTLSLERQGQEILGGDMSLSLVHRQATAEERAAMEADGTVSEIATLRAMARKVSDKRAAMVRLKAADASYPLYGTLRLKGESGPIAAEQVLTRTGTAVAERLLLERIGARIGDVVKVGETEIRIVAEIEKEPDQLSGRPTFGPRMIVSQETLRATQLLQPGSLVNWHYRLRLPEGADARRLDRLKTEFAARFPESGFQIRDRSNPAPRLERMAARFGQFLTLAGITTLMIGGVGVANAVAAYLERKRGAIATFKCLGASGSLVFRVYLAEVLMLALAGVAIGLVAGSLLPLAVAKVAEGALPVALAVELQPGALALAALYGLLTALLFVLWPLGRARDLPPALLFRQGVSAEASRPHRRYLAGSAVCAAGIVLVAVATAQDRLLAFLACLGIAAALLLFLGLGMAMRRLAARLPAARHAALSLARASLAGPAGLTRPVALSLGAGLTVLVAVSLVDRSLIAEFDTRLPIDAPDYFVLDVPRERIGEFREIVHDREPDARIDEAPMLRGRIVKVKDTPASEIKPPANIAWVLDGDRGLTYSDFLPEGSRLVAGEWWSKGHDGEPLVSFEKEIADGLGLTIGDHVTINVLGRNLTARIANLRSVDWESLSINFVMVFSPNALNKAPHNFLATLTLPAEAGAKREAQVIQEVADRFPSSSAMRVRDALDTIRAISEKVMIAVRAAGALTLVMGALVLAGAMTAAHRRRVRDAVIFKTLGATRGRLVVAHLAEYGALALMTGAAAALLGTLAAWLIVTLAMEAGFAFSLAAVLQSIGLATATVLLFGAIGTWRVLGTGAAAELRRA
ncbi:MAG: FtsX-like permease family protein [Pseudomonadota bacterium]|nr:FtsX-like permease family protein [Pseudomonadota bacterium]